jgi:hypothetical protein
LKENTSTEFLIVLLQKSVALGKGRYDALLEFAVPNLLLIYGDSALNSAHEAEHWTAIKCTVIAIVTEVVVLQRKEKERWVWQSRADAGCFRVIPEATIRILARGIVRRIFTARKRPVEFVVL